MKRYFTRRKKNEKIYREYVKAENIKFQKENILYHHFKTNFVEFYGKRLVVGKQI